MKFLQPAVRERIEEWAQFFQGDGRPALYYPSLSSAAWLQERHYLVIKNKGYKPLPCNAGAEEIEQWVREMAQENPVMAQILRCEHFEKGSQVKKSRRLGLSIFRFRAYLRWAYAWLEDKLIPTPPGEKK